MLVRYADDLVVLCRTKREAEAALAALRSLLAELGLEPKQAKLRKRLRDPVEEVVKDINRYLRGWGGYFRYGHSALHFDRISNYAFKRLALFVAKRHQRKAGYGLSVVAYWSPDRLGLVSLNGTVVSPRANKPWRVKPNAAGEGRR